MTEPKRIFVVLDSETTKKDGLVFDAGWNSIDRKGNNYGVGSYIFNDVLQRDNPWYKEKIAKYWEMAYNHQVKPIPFAEFREIFNGHIEYLREQNFKPVICAYNAPFDVRVIRETSLQFTGQSFLKAPVDLLCIWHAWALSCPRNYTAEKSPAGNIRTNAESVYAFEMQVPGFIEDHTGFADTEIEAAILLKVLARKKALPIVQNPKDFYNQPWRIVQERIGNT